MTDTSAEIPTAVAEPHTGDDFDDQDSGNPTPDPAEDTLRDAGKQAIERMKAERAAARKEARELRAELDQFRQASLTDREREVEDARTEAKRESMTYYGQQLARARFDALAAKQNPDADTDDILEFVDMRRFLDEEGEIDDKALQAAVKRLVPAAPKADPSFDGGARTTGPKVPDMNAIIRNQAFGRRNA